MSYLNPKSTINTEYSLSKLKRVPMRPKPVFKEMNFGYGYETQKHY